MSRMRFRILAFVLSMVVPALAWAAGGEPQRLPVETLVVEGRDGPVTLRTEIADDGLERAIGMMHRTEVPPGTAMLFQYPRPTQVSMWMRNTLVALDMLFIDGDGTIVHIEHDAQPHDETPRGAAGLVIGVLEIGGGEAARLGIEEGMTVRHPFFGPAAPAAAQ